MDGLKGSLATLALAGLVSALPSLACAGSVQQLTAPAADAAGSSIATLLDHVGTALLEPMESLNAMLSSSPSTQLDVTVDAGQARFDLGDVSVILILSGLQPLSSESEQSTGSNIDVDNQWSRHLRQSWRPLWVAHDDLQATGNEELTPAPLPASVLLLVSGLGLIGAPLLLGRRRPSA